MSRADKINRIKKSVRPENAAPKVQKASDVPDWEENINRILAKKDSKSGQAGKATAESILAEIYGGEAFHSAHVAEPEIVPQPESVPEQTAVSEPESINEPEIVPEPEIIPEPEIVPQSVFAPKPVISSVPEDKKETSAVPESLAFAVPEEKGKMKKNNTSKKKKKKKKTFGQRFLGLFPQKGDSVLEIIRKIVFLISIIAIVVCGYLVADYYIDLWKNKKVNEEMRSLYWSYETTEPAGGEKHPSIEPVKEGEQKPVYTLLPGAEKLLEINKDVIGYIKIDGTPVDNVLLRGKDNFEYLNKKINGDENRTGELFLDWRNHFDDVDDEGHLRMPNSQNLVVYGHAMKDESMLGCLIKYRNTSDYYSEHPIIHLNSNYSHYTYKIFAVFILDSEDKSETRFDCWSKFDFRDEQDFYNFVNEAKRRTIRTNDVDVKYGDQLLTLSTCDDYLGDRGRLIIMARQVRDGEDQLKGTEESKSNPNIKWPTMYYNTKSDEHYDPEDFVPYNAPAKKNDDEAKKVSVPENAS